MGRNIAFLILFVSLFVFWGHRLYAQFSPDPVFSVKEAQGPVVVELFTSQSCSSCPPADKVLGALAEHENVIALSCNVTYWNHLSWKDTLSQEFCTQRQRGYAAYRGSGRVYTPQMVVNGEEEFVGSNRGQAQDAVNKGAGKIAQISLSRVGEEVEITLPPVAAGGYTLWVMGIGPAVTQDIPSGENRGRALHYTNPVGTLDKLAAWSGVQESRSFKISESAELAGIAVIAQSGDFGPVVAAGKMMF